MKKRIIIPIVSSIVIVAIVISCVINFTMDNVNSGVRIGFVGNNTSKNVSASFKYFNGKIVKKVKFHEGEDVNIHYELKEKSGSLSITIYDADGKMVKEIQGTGEGDISFQVERTQKYKIRIRAKKAKGSYKLSW